MTEKDFETQWIEKLKKEERNFPNDFIDLDEFEEFTINRKVLTLGSEFFGSFEIIDTNGNVINTVDNYSEAKYYFYASRNKPETIKVPAEKEKTLKAVKIYELYLDSILKEIESAFKAAFPDSKRHHNVSNQIFNLANLKRY